MTTDTVPLGTAAPATQPEPLGRRFHALVTSTGLANLADGVVQVGLPLYAITLTRSPLQVSLLTAAAWLPWLLLAVLGGLLVDRTDRRHAQLAGLTVRVLALAGGTALIASGRMTMDLLVLLALVYGATDVVVDLAQNALVPDVAPRSRLQAANGRVMAVQQVAASFVGAPVAGLLIGVGGSWLLATGAGLAAAAVAVLAVGVRGDYRHPTGAAARGVRGAVADVREGLAVLVRHPVLRPLTIGAALSNMASAGYSALLVLWAVGAGSAIGLSAVQFTWVGVAMAIGAVLGSIVTERVVHRFGELPVLLGGWAVAAALAAVPVLVPEPAALYPAVVLLAAANTAGNVVSQSVRQRLVPARLLGRVTGGGRTLAYGLMPIGAVAGGAAATVWGLGPVLLATCAVSAVAPLIPALTVRATMLTAPADAGTPTAADRATDGDGAGDVPSAASVE